MRIAHITIQNFRGIKKGELHLPKSAVLVGDNNCGKSTVLEAIDLCLGPERLAKRPVIDEHDFYAGRYVDAEKNSVEIKIAVVIVDLSAEQQRHFRNHLEWWNESSQTIIAGPPPEGTDLAGVVPALRIGFTGAYNKEEDDFDGTTYYLSPPRDDGGHDSFWTSDKRVCGFLFLRTLRTGSRALSLERGSLLDIILRLQNKRLQMWEEVLEQLRKLPVAEKKELGITDILSTVQTSLRSFVPSEWADNPHMRVSDLTRENLRKILTVFMGTGAKTEDGSNHAAPFQHQGTGTINALVLALLSIIAELKQNVIFAMEEPEIAIPPHTQKRIIKNVQSKSAQAIFTSHSPYVLEEFKPSEIVLLRREGGELVGTAADYPPTVKPKAYRLQLRTRFCEAILARRVLIVEGRTENDAIPAAARRLNELHSDVFKSLEGLGIAVVNAETDSQIAPLGQHFSGLGKQVFAVFDKQEATAKVAIEAAVPHAYESPESGFEKLILKGTAPAALQRFAIALVADQEWPDHLSAKAPTSAMSDDDLRDALADYFLWSKGSGTIADLLGQCSRDEMPGFLVQTLAAIRLVAEPPQAAQPATAASTASPAQPPPAATE